MKSMLIMSSVCVILAVHSTALAQKKVPAQFASIKEMMQKCPHLSNYSDDGQFRMLGTGEQIARFQLSPLVVSNDPEEVVGVLVKHAALDGVLRAFIHTNVDVVVVTSVPLSIEGKGKKKVYRTTTSKTIAIDRKTALAILKKLARIASFNDLVHDETIFGRVYVDSYTKVGKDCVADRLMEKVFAEFQKAPKPKALQKLPSQVRPKTVVPAKTVESRDERNAASTLRIAQRYLSKGRKASAKEWLLKTVKRYPNTKAAAEAARLLKGH